MRCVFCKNPVISTIYKYFFRLQFTAHNISDIIKATNQKLPCDSESQGSSFISSFHRFFAEKVYETLFVTLMQFCTNHKVSVCKGFGNSNMAKIEYSR